MSAKLGDGYLVNPQLTISVKEYNSQKVFVMGEVNKAGTYPVTKENNLVYLLSQAGGPTKDAGEEVVIIRPNNPHSRIITLEEAEVKKVPITKVNLKDALTGDPKHNVPIRNGESIIVSKMPYFFVMGEVKIPGKYNLERGTTVLMGISMGGGLTAKAAQNRTKIVREKDEKKIEMKVTMDTLVLPGDTIIVPESFF
jgi:polysaccharide biosynthesis/export protein